MKKQTEIYLDYQASTPTDTRIVERMLPFFAEEFGNPHSADHVYGWRANQEVEAAKAELANLLGTDIDEIIFTSGATESNNHAILGCAAAARETSRTRVIVSAVEHKCVLAAAYAAADLYGTEVLTAPVDSTGRIDLNWLADHTDDRVAIVSVIGVNNEIGSIQDFLAIAEITHKAGALFHSDCAQAPIAISMNTITPCMDLISLSGHKVYGPKGIGALFINRDIQDRIAPLIYGGGQQNNLRSGTVPTHLAVGLGKAFTLLHDDWGTERQRLQFVRDKFVDCLKNSGIEIDLITPCEVPTHPGNANVRFVGINAYDILHSVQPLVAASTGSACTSGTPEPSHVLRAIGLTEREAEECIRFSFGRGTTLEELESAVDIIVSAANELSLAERPD